MNKWITLFLIILIVELSHGQTYLRKVELGAILFTSSTYPSFNNLELSIDKKLQLQYLNGIFLRVNIKSIAIRNILQYHKQSSITVPSAQCADCQTKEEHVAEYKIGLGIQINNIANQDWFYSFADFSYANSKLNGVYTGGFSGESTYFKKTLKGIEMFTGIGFKVGLWHRLFISPEFGISNLYGNSVDTRSSSTTKYAPIYSHELKINPWIRLHFTVGF